MVQDFKEAYILKYLSGFYETTDAHNLNLILHKRSTTLYIINNELVGAEIVKHPTVFIKTVVPNVSPADHMRPCGALSVFQ